MLIEMQELNTTISLLIIYGMPKFYIYNHLAQKLQIKEWYMLLMRATNLIVGKCDYSKNTSLRVILLKLVMCQEKTILKWKGILVIFFLQKEK